MRLYFKYIKRTKFEKEFRKLRNRTFTIHVISRLTLKSKSLRFYMKLENNKLIVDREPVHSNEERTYFVSGVGKYKSLKRSQYPLEDPTSSITLNNDIPFGENLVCLLHEIEKDISDGDLFILNHVWKHCKRNYDLEMELKYNWV